MPPVPAWFDAHLDLAYLAVNGRDMLSSLASAEDRERVGGPHPPASITLPSLAEGRVRFVLGTIFTEQGGPGPEGYPVSDTVRAHAAGRAQLEVYLTWRDRGLIGLDLREALAGGAGLGEVRGGMGVAEVVPLSIAARLARLRGTTPLHVGVLIENADPIRTPEELGWWQERGVVAVGMAWARSSRYAGGNMGTEGISDLGRALVKEMDRLGVMHDASHLSERAFDELFDLTDRPVIASHSNCRAIVDPTGTVQRHLTDAQIARISGRGGVIGLNLFSKFIDPVAGETVRASIARCVEHIERVCEIAGKVSPIGSGRAHVGLGSDADGGFAASRLPEGIDLPRDYRLLADALSARGWSEDEVNGFACGNWMRVFGG